jgi:hypothetical protein
MEMASHHDRIERTVLLQEIESILNGLVAGPNADRDRLIFWLYYRSGLAANSIASIPSIDLTTKGVESTLQRMTTQLRNHLCPSVLSSLRNLPEDKGNVAGDSL